MADENRVCVVDCCTGSDGSTTAARLLSELTGISPENVDGHAKWNISNRYYEAEVCLEVQSDLDEYKRGWQALIAICNLNQPSSVKKAYSMWEELPTEATPPVSLLVGVVDVCGLQEGVRGEVVQWCLKRGVEFVEWELDAPKNEEDDEEDFPESVGVARISEALQAHMWPEMSLKKYGRRGGDENSGTDGAMCNGGNDGTERTCDSTDVSSTAVRDGTTVEEARQSTDANDTETSVCSGSSSSATAGSLPTDESSASRLNELLGASDTEILERGGEKGVEDFEALFAKFADMKANAQSLPHEERKAYAEKVVMSFWKAIGGDDCSGSDSEQ